MTAEEIQLRRVPKPREHTQEELLEWFIQSLGLEHGRDIHQTLRAVVHMLFSLLSREEGVTTDVLEDKLGMPSSRINHHLRLLVKAGVIEREKRRIRMRGRSISETVEEIRKDSERLFDDILTFALELDREYGFPIHRR